MRGIPRAAPKSTLLFLSHAGEDAQAARDLATLIRGAGLDVWLDVEQLKPGDLWQREIAAALKNAQALILYVGRSGVARWVDFEVQIALDRSAKERKFRMIPVLGPGSDPEALPDFLKLFQWVDLRGPKPLMAKLKTMLARITGEAPERVTALPPERPPFLGLQNFDVADAVVFFGREKEVDELLGHLRRDNFLLVVGDSGCGKSSLVCAGLIPALARGRFHDGHAWVASWRVAITRPGRNPFRELAENLPDLDPASLLRAERIASNRRLLAEGADGLRDIVAASARAGQHTLLVVDQFEELFTQTADPTARRRFIDCLLRAAASGGSRPVHVVLTLRADFYARCWEHPDLPALVARNQYPVGRMRPEQLRALIEGPLSLAGAQAEAGLVEAILEEAGDQPGSLALVEHVLDQLWRDRRADRGGVWITHQAYEKLGRLGGALRRHANEVMDHLSVQHARALAKRIFVDLVQFGEDSADTRRRVPIEELLAASGEPEAARLVLDMLASERLVTMGKEHAEIAHETLIRCWPELREWVDAGRNFVRLERRLAEDAREWERLRRDPGALLAGARLAEAEELLRSAGREPRPLVRSFVEASIAERERMQEAERARQLATQAQLLVVQAQLLEKDRPALLESRARLAAESMRRSPTLAADRIIRECVRLLPADQARLEHRGFVISTAFSPDAQWLATGSSDGMARLWETASGKLMMCAEHEDSVYSVRFSADGGMLLTASRDGTARLWELPGGREAARFQHGHPVIRAVFSPDGRWIATGGTDHTARVWETASANELFRMEHGASVGAVAFSPDGERLATGGDDRAAHVWDAVTGKEIARLEHEEAARAVVFSPDGKWVVSGSLDGSTRIWEVATGSQREQLDYGGVVLSFSPDGRWLAGGGWDRAARIWEFTTGKEVARLEHGEQVRALGFSPDGRWLATASDDFTARVWLADVWKEVTRVEHSDNVHDVSFSPDSRWIATGCRQESALWKTPSAGMKHDAEVIALAFSPDSRRVVSGASVDLTHDKDRTAVVHVWEWKAEQKLANLNHWPRGVQAVAFAPDGESVVTCGWDDFVRVWDLATATERSQIKSPVSATTNAAFSFDCRLAASGIGGAVVVWETATGREVVRTNYGSEILAIAVSTGSAFVATAGADKTARLWDLASGRELARVRHSEDARAIAISPDGRWVVSGGEDNVARVWEAATGKKLAHMEHGGVVCTLAFSLDGQLVASGSLDGSARLWEGATGKELSRIEDPEGARVVAFSPDGRWLATGSFGGTVAVHAVRPDDLLQELSARISRNLRPEEWANYLGDEPYRKTFPNLP